MNTSELSDSASSLNLDIYDGTTDNDADSQSSDNDYNTNMINEIDGQLNKLTYIQDQLHSHLKNLISLSAHNYLLRQNQEVVKMNEIFVHKNTGHGKYFKECRENIGRKFIWTNRYHVHFDQWQSKCKSWFSKEHQ